MSRAFIVLGMPRTGTSLAMGLLNKMGVYTGKSRTGPNNPEYFEYELLFKLIQQQDGITAKKVIDRIQEESNGLDWGIKHPSIANRWSEFEPHIDEPTFIVTNRRDKDAQYASHKNAAINNQSREVFNARDVAYYRTVVDLIKPYKFFFVNYEDWFLDSKQLQRLAEVTELPLTESAKDLIQPDLKHY